MQIFRPRIPVSRECMQPLFTIPYYKYKYFIPTHGEKYVVWLVGMYSSNMTWKPVVVGWAENPFGRCEIVLN